MKKCCWGRQSYRCILVFLSGVFVVNSVCGGAGSRTPGVNTYPNHRNSIADSSRNYSGQYPYNSTGYSQGRPIQYPCNVKSVFPEALQSVIDRYYHHSFTQTDNFFAYQNPYKQIYRDTYAHSLIHETVVPANRDYISILTAHPNNNFIRFNLNGSQTFYDLNQLSPVVKGTGAYDYKVYGTEDPVTHQRVATAIEIQVFEYQPPRRTGIARIDQDRLLKFTNRIKRHDGDEDRDTYFGSLLFKVTPQGLCPVHGVRRMAIQTETIRLTQGREYRFNLGPNQFPPRPFTDEYQKRIQALADFQIASAVSAIDNLHCEAVTSQQLQTQMSQLPVGVPQECRW